jgi:ribosomal protein S3
MNREEDLADQVHVYLMQMIPVELQKSIKVNCSIHETNSGKEYSKTKITITTSRPSSLIGRSGWICKLICEVLELRYHTQVSVGIKEFNAFRADEIVGVLSFSKCMVTVK